MVLGPLGNAEIAVIAKASCICNGSWPAIVRYPSHHVGEFDGTEIAAVALP